ncbi:glycosyltransferase 87 family protein [Catellatospora sichuanensis]|uniref:glycosyltransferase 87 family protein n=1 Tax=Catellatospora sichuanensis TaxID=1969805 RepID=UPI001182F6E7|nr:glycosyltransferase 87 family protein [Catellatospora sichuanensis]
MIEAPPSIWRRVDRAADGLAADLGLYAGSALFAWFTIGSTLTSHRAWGAVAVWGYAAAALAVLVQLALRLRRRTAASLHDHSTCQPNGGKRAQDTHECQANPAILPGSGAVARAWVVAGTWVAVTVVPLVAQAVARAGGMSGRAQEEVLVVEESARRLLDSGTPYLGRDGIAALPEPLLGYTPYQPGMSVFGLPRAVFGDAWWTDARIWFALVTALVVALAARLLRDGTAGRDALLVRAVQAATVLPLCALTLSTGGDDLPVLALCLLALALAARDRFGWAGVAIGAAAAMKLLAWPVALVLGAYALVRKAGGRYAVGAAGLPVLVLIPALLVEPAAFVENVIRFPTGHGLVTSPAASPLLGYLIAQHLPAGRIVALALLALAGLAVGLWLLRRPPRDAGSAALIIATGLLLAILLMPATRFGYLLYPAALALWSLPLRPPARVDHEPMARVDGMSQPQLHDR